MNLLLVLVCVTAMPAVEKQSVVVLVGTNFWNNPLIWSSTGEPGEGHDVSIGDGIDTPGFDAANIPIFYTTLLPDPTILGQLKINALSIQGADLENLNPFSLAQISLSPFLSRGIHQAGLTLRTTSEIYGDDKTGYFLQTGGLHTVEHDVTLGRLDGASGAYLINAPIDGVLRVRRDFIVGDAGRGIFQQLLGELIVQNDLWLGKSASGAGFGLSAGPLQVWNDMFIGGDGFGFLSLGPSEVAPTVGGQIVLGRASTGNGILEFAADTQITATGMIVVGDQGTGELRVGVGLPHAGTVATDAELIIGRQAGSTGIVGGVSLEVGTDLVVGDAGDGTATLQFGTFTPVGRDLVIGRESTGTGTLNIGTGSVLLLNGSPVSVIRDVRIGDQGQGSLFMLTGTMAVGGRLGIGYQPGSSGSLILGGLNAPVSPSVTVAGDIGVGDQGSGQLTLHGLARITATGDLMVGGADTGSGTVTLNYVSAVTARDFLVGVSTTGTINVLEGSEATATRDLVIGGGPSSPGTVSVSGIAQLNVGDRARIYQGELALSGVAGVDIAGTLEIGAGVLGDGLVTFTGGSFAAGGQAWIGRNGEGTWTQSGGSVTFSSDLFLGDETAGTGLMNISGGTLSALGFSLFDSGTLNLSGGSMNLGSLQLLGGTLNNSGGQLIVGDLFLGGGTVTGDIKATGTITIDPTVNDFDGHVDSDGYFELNQPFSPSGGLTTAGTTVITDGGILTTHTAVINADGHLTVENGGKIDVYFLRNEGGTFTMKPASTVLTNFLIQTGGFTEIEEGDITVRDELSIENGRFTTHPGANLHVDFISVGDGGELYLAGDTWVPPRSATTRLEINYGGLVDYNATDSISYLYLPDHTEVIGAGDEFTVLTGRGSWFLEEGSTMLLSRAMLRGNGTLTVAPGALLDIIGNGTTIERPIFNHAQLNINAAADVPGTPMEGGATITNEADGTLRILNEPLHDTSANYNRLSARLNFVNAGTMTFGASSPQTGNAAYPWFWLNYTFANSGSLSLLQNTTFTIEDSFNNTGTITLANASNLTVLGGGTMQGTLELGSQADSFAVFRGVTVHDTGATFSGSGFVSVEGGTLHTLAGEYMPTVNFELLADPTMPEATGLAVGNGHWLRIAGSVPALPVRVASGGTLELMGGINTSAITVEQGATMRLGDSYSNPTNHTRPDEPNVFNAVLGQPGRGDIENHGTLNIVPGTVTGTGRVLNRADGVAEAVSTFAGEVRDMLLEVINEGILNLHAKDESPTPTNAPTRVQFGDITNTGTVTIRATEFAADAFDDVQLWVGNYTQTAGTTLIETGATGFGSPFLQAGTFSNLGGSVAATGRMTVSNLLNQSVFGVGATGLNLTGSFSNQSGGDLRLDGTFVVSNAFTFGSGSRILLNGVGASLVVNGTPVLAGDFTTPAGTTIELRDRSLNSGSNMTTHGTLIIGSGATMQRTSGYLNGNGEVRVADGGTLVLSGGFDGSGSGPINIEAGGLLSMPSRAFGIYRFHGRTLTNDGTVTHAVGSLSLNAGTTITNNGVWSVSLPGAGDVGGYITEGGQTQGGSFINHGTFNQNGANILYFSNGPTFANHGTVNVNSGELRIHSQGAFSGTSVVNIAAGAQLLLRDGTSTIQSGARFQGAGTFALGDAGQHILNGEIYADNASFWGGTLSGTHTLHGTWSKTGTGGNMGTAGTTTIAADGIWNFQASTNLRGRTFDNLGTVNHADGTLEFSPDTLIQNHGTWNDSSAGDSFTSQNAPQGGLFENFGIFNKTGAGTLSFASGPGFTNHSIVNVNTGIFSLHRTNTFTGTSVVNIASGATLQLRDGTSNLETGARFQGAGTLSLGDAGQHNLNGDIYADNVSFWGGTLHGTHTLHGTWSKSGTGGNMGTAGTTTIAADGIWNFQGGTNLTNRTFVNDGAVTHTDGGLGMNASTVIRNNGIWTDSSGVTINSSGHLIGLIANTGTFIKTGANTLDIDHGNGPAFSNTGTVDVQQGTPQLNHKLVQHVGSTLTAGTWIVRNGATLREDFSTAYTINQADVTLHGTGDYSPLNALTTNAGTLRLLDGKAFTAVNSPFTNSGTLLVGAGSSFSTASTFANSGTLDLSGVFSATGGLTNTGTLGGSGTFTGSLTNGGVLSPGNSPGLMTVTGNLTLLAASDLVMELDGLVEGVSYDSFDVSGTLTFGGDLIVTLINAFVPATGATFNLFDASAFSGTFATMSLPTLTAGLAWDTSALYSAGSLSVTGSAVPEPSTYTLLAGVAALGVATWRRRTVRS